MSCDELTRLTLMNFVPRGTIKVAVEVNPSRTYPGFDDDIGQPSDAKEPYWKDVLIMPPYQDGIMYRDLLGQVDGMVIRSLGYPILFAIKERYPHLNIGPILASGSIRRFDREFKIPILDTEKDVVWRNLQPNDVLPSLIWLIAEQVA